ncbi:hypothetical protein Pmar_PMAR004386 [Perkinsus marinus ATCC 50983]|uniref:Uncharacterized protein n=1 Tax=Perkinsus marinus (strain ATCC 50983 / TXsc) TaxID=423536 RepID=C5KAI5_PERM5|nr:hypothetical protein Pmar_PMAR004386 [Perkinsus marinus ATCC 50983]EER18521.1 hypothetical protein Pmar_PMAR004386 [Perkinsus marinus ATCC 50983]|eukprot:XP_002786725.1 hypothetical protein Pmar_PMAR004386 [Perkinsus marinus ATCC 50983]
MSSKIVKDIFEAVSSASEDSLQLLSAMLTIDGVEEKPAFEAPAAEADVSVVEVILDELVEFVKKSRDHFCIRNADLRVVEIGRSDKSETLVVARARLEILPARFAIQVEDGFLPCADSLGEAAIINIKLVTNDDRSSLPTVKVTSLALRSDDIDIQWEREDVDGGVRYKVFPPKTNLKENYATTR